MEAFKKHQKLALSDKAKKDVEKAKQKDIKVCCFIPKQYENYFKLVY